MRAERSEARSGGGGGYPSPRSGGPRPRPVPRERPRGRYPEEPSSFDEGYGRAPSHRASAPVEPVRRGHGSSVSRWDDEAPAGPRTHGAVAALGVFLVTLAAAAADSYFGVGLGTITLVALVGSTVVATLVVRRRDVTTMVVAPPLVYLGVVLANVAAAPSVSFSLPTVATGLIRGFPAMAIAVGAALILWLFRLARRR